MSPPRQHRRNHWLGLLKDRISTIKASILVTSHRRPSSAGFRLAVIRATTHDPSTAPPTHFIEDLLELSHLSPGASSAACSELVSRLQKTRDPFVALKCLISLHRILPSLESDSDANNVLNLSHFHRDSNNDPEISNWVRWYAGEIQQVLITSRSLGFHFTATGTPPSSSSTSSSRTLGVVDHREIKKSVPLSRFSTAVLFAELDSLASMLEVISTAPDSLQLQRIGLIFEAVRLAGEDYRMTMREVLSRTQEVEGRIDNDSINDDGIDEFLKVLGRIQKCKEKLVLMFLNKKHGVWEAIEEAKHKAEAEKRRRDGLRVVVPVERSKSSMTTRGGRWLDVEWNKKELTVRKETETTTTTNKTTTTVDGGGNNDRSTLLPPLIEF